MHSLACAPAGTPAQTPSGHADALLHARTAQDFLHSQPRALRSARAQRSACNTGLQGRTWARPWVTWRTRASTNLLPRMYATRLVPAGLTSDAEAPPEESSVARDDRPQIPTELELAAASSSTLWGASLPSRHTATVGELVQSRGTSGWWIWERRGGWGGLPILLELPGPGRMRRFQTYSETLLEAFLMI